MDWREFIANSRAQVSLPFPYPAMEFGLLSLLWLSSTPMYMNLALGFPNSLQFSPFYDLLLPFAVLFLGLRAWGGLCKFLVDSRTGFRSKCSPKPQSYSELGVGSRSHGVCCYACEGKMKSCNGFRSSIGGRKDDEEDERVEEGLGFDDVMKLRKELAKERELRVWTEMELEKERRAASSAADEAMAKILLLSNEKGLVEREARMYHEMAEQKQAYDRDVIENLKWIISNLQEENFDDD